jgi:hypothetical protein
MRALSAAALACVTAFATPGACASQRLSDAWPNPFPQAAGAPSSVAPPLLSLALPGAGQHVLGQRRKWVYAALEVAGWAFWLERRAAAGDYRDRYRDFAWAVGRIQGASRVDGDFDYYERLTHWSRSGAFDADPTLAGVQPEGDPTTYNGSIWSRAMQIYLPPGQSVPVGDPAYQSAVAYYEQRAYGTTFLWDWTGAPEGQAELARLIRASDDRYGHATTILGAIIANHLVSAADAYLSARARSNPVSIRFVPALGFGAGPAPAWSAIFRVGVGP